MRRRLTTETAEAGCAGEGALSASERVLSKKLDLLNEKLDRFFAAQASSANKDLPQSRSKELYTLSELTEILCCSEGTVYNNLKLPDFPFRRIQVGKRAVRYVPKSEVKE